MLFQFNPSLCKKTWAHRFTRGSLESKFLHMNTVTQEDSSMPGPVNVASEASAAPVDAVKSMEDQAGTAAGPQGANSGDVEPRPADAAVSLANAEAVGQQSALDQMPLRQVLEALLFASDVPLMGAKIAQTLGLDSVRAVKLAVEELNESYTQREAAFRVEERAGGYQILTLPQYAEYIQRLMRKRDEGRLTPAALETLAIIAYKQPILRVDVEAIRGVACGDVIRTLMEYNLVKIVGRAEEVGRPMLYGTTKHFLEVFGLSSLKDLPRADQLKEPT